jgi:predicted Zn-dependent protease
MTPQSDVRNRPIVMLFQKGMSDLEKNAIMDGVQDISSVAEAELEGYLYDGFLDGEPECDSLKPYMSVDWFLMKGRETSHQPGKYFFDEIQKHLYLNVKRRYGNSIYMLLALNVDIYSSDSLTYILGGAHSGIGTTLSTFRFRKLPEHLAYDCIKTETMHEMGHVFGLIPGSRTTNVENKLGRHCTSVCTMRQGLNVPDDWIQMSYLNKIKRPFCTDCRDHLIEYFRE